MRITLNKKTILLFMLLFPYFEPGLLEKNYYIDQIYNVLKILSLIIVIILYIKNNKLPSKFVLVSFLYGFWLIIVSFIKNANIFGSFVITASVVNILLIIDIYISNIEELFNSILYNTYWIIVVNLFNIINNFAGFRNYLTDQKSLLIGNANSVIDFVFPLIYIYLIRKQFAKNKLLHIIMLLIGIISIVLCWSVTSIISLGIIVLILMIQKRKKKRINIHIISFVYVLLDFVITKSLFTFDSNILINVLLKILNRDNTYTKRMYIWDLAKNKIKISPIIGYGSSTHIIYDNQELYAHNLIYQLLMMGGIVLVIITFILFAIIINKIKKCKINDMYYINTSMISGLFLRFIPEAILSNETFVILALLYNSSAIEKYINRINNEQYI